MAATAAAAGVEDDDSWLYGSDEPVPEKNELEVDVPSKEENDNVEDKDEDELRPDGSPKDSGKEAGELSGEDQDATAGIDDSDSDDDDVQVTIKDINSTAGYGAYGAAPVNLNITKRTPYAQTVNAAQANNITVSGKTKGLDIDTVGSINGVPSYDFNLDTLDEKPWMKPGADITDYFNYGFHEESWRLYCERQKKLRLESSSGTGLISLKTGKDATGTLPTVNENSKYTGPTAVPVVVVAGKKAGPPPGRKMSGSIDVIGGGAPSSLASRRVSTSPPKENPIQVMTGRTAAAPSGMPLGMTSMPPPGYMGPPHNMSMPPPGIMPPGMPVGPLPIPPPNLSVPPPNFQDPYSFNRFPPPSSGNIMNSHQGMSPGNKTEESYDKDRSQKYDPEYRNNSYSHDRDRESRRDYDRKDSSRSRDSERYRESGRERDEQAGSRTPEDTRRYRDHRDRDHDHERRDRDRERRHRDRDRDKEREERHRSKRKHHRDDDDDYDKDREESSDKHRSSRHKRKRSRKDREEADENESKEAAANREGTPTASEEAPE